MHSVEAQLARMTRLFSNTPEIVSGVCVLSGAPAEMSLIQMAGVMATVPLAALLFCPRLSVMINRKNMVVSFGEGITFVVVLHQVWKKNPVRFDYLGFYVVDSHRMSALTHGLLGMERSSFRLCTGQREKPRERPSPPQTTARSTLCLNPGRPVAMFPGAVAGADSVNAFIPRTILQLL